MLYSTGLRQGSIRLLTFIKVLGCERTDGSVLMAYAVLSHTVIGSALHAGRVEPRSSGSGLRITASPQNGPLNPQSFYKSHIDAEHVT